jgi:hypothetical protein
MKSYDQFVIDHGFPSPLFSFCYLGIQGTISGPGWPSLKFITIPITIPPRYQADATANDYGVEKP